MKQKLPVPALAKELYTSPLFRKGRRYAEVAGVPWFVLSAEHGLVLPEELLAPYDRRLSRSDHAYRRAWGARVVDRLLAEAGPLQGKTVEVHAGAAYAAPIRQLLAQAGATVVEPLAGLKLGLRLSWYGRSAGAPKSTHIPAAPNVSDLVGWLTDSKRADSPAAFLATGGDGLRSPASTRGGSIPTAQSTSAVGSAPISPPDLSTPAWPERLDREVGESQRTPCGDASKRCTSVVVTSSRRFD